MKKLLSLLLLAIVLILSACGSDNPKKELADTESVTGQDEVNETEDEQIETEEEEEPVIEEVVELTPKQEIFSKIVDLIDEGLAFDTGSYIKGDIPKGEYAFVTFEESGNYYSEEDSAGDIIDNENFSSFGYVQVHEAGNIKTKGALVKIEALEQLGVSGAKELYEVMNELENYTDSGWYKVGIDIEPGEYIFESYGSGYFAVMTGPVGNNDIVRNDNFEGRTSATVQEGQYLKLSKAYISK